MFPDSPPPPEPFAGTAPLFPLPGVAFFPHVLLPLHIFEPRYRQMTADALAGDRYIALAQPRPGWELLPPGASPPIYDIVCLGRIAADDPQPDGRYHLLLQGVARAVVLAEEPADRPYRVARLSLRPDRVAVPAALDRENRRREILEAFRDLHPKLNLDQMLHEVLDGAASLGLLCDVVASALGLPAERTQEILAETDIDARSDLVLARLRELRRQSAAPRPEKFPPDFSLN